MTKKERIEQLRTEIQQAEEGIKAILLGAQSYSIAGQTITRANLDSITKYKNELVKELTILTKGTLRRTHRVIH